MELSSKILYKNLKPHIADAIKESCYKIDARLYNVANDVHNITTTSLEPGVDIAKDLSKIIDKTIKEASDLGCDLSVIIKGILIGAFRASPFIRQEAHQTIRLLILETLQPVFKYKCDTKKVIVGLLAAIVIISREFKLNTQEALIIAKEDIISCATSIDPKFADEIKEIMPSLDNA